MIQEALIAQKAIIFNKEGNVLLTKRATKSGLNEWSFPGGGLDEKEDLREGITREVLEETGLTLLNLRVIDAGTMQKREDALLLVIAYMAEVDDDTVVLNEEHSAYKWVTKEEAINVVNLPLHKEFLKKIT